MIKELNELVWYADRLVSNEKELLATLSQHPRVLQLYLLLKKEPLLTDDEVLRAFGGNSTEYKKRVRELREILLNLVFLFNAEKGKIDARARALLEGRRAAAGARLLYDSGCRHAAQNVAREVLRKGRKYDHPRFVVEACELLKESVIRVEGSLQEFNEFSDLYWEYKQYVDLEHKAWEFYQRTCLSNFSDMASMEAYLAEMVPFLGKIPSFSFHLYYFLIRNYFCYGNRNFGTLLENCQEAIVFFSKKPYPVTNPLSVFFYNQIQAFTMIGDFQAGKAAAEKALEFAHVGTPNWFNTLELYTFLNFHAGHYREAFALYAQGSTHRRLPYMREEQQDIWQVIGAYCFIIYKMASTPKPEGLASFRSARFINSINVVRQHKRGANIAVQVAYVLLQLIEGKYDEVYNRMEALEKYRIRHLSKDKQMLRADLLVRMLSILPRVEFNGDRWMTRISPLVNKLREEPRHFFLHMFEQEMVPYENLITLVARFCGARTLPPVLELQQENLRW